MVKPLRLFVLLLALLIAGCSTNEQFSQKVQPNETNLNNTLLVNKTPTQVNREPTPKFTPPPLIMTPIPPGAIVRDFIKFYNERNATKLYEMFSDRVKENYSIEDVEDELRFAEEHNITLRPNERLFVKDGLLKNGTMLFKVNLTLSYNNHTKNVTVVFPLLYVKYSVKKGDYTYVGFHAYIDGWIFSELKKAVLTENIRR